MIDYLHAVVQHKAIIRKQNIPSVLDIRRKPEWHEIDIAVGRHIITIAVRAGQYALHAIDGRVRTNKVWAYPEQGSVMEKVVETAVKIY